MNKFLSILIFIVISLNVEAQTFCLQLTEVSNDGTNMVVSVDAQGSEAFNLGSANLQFAASNGAFGAATLVNSPLVPPTYFTPTVTQPNPEAYSLNIELVFPGISLEVAAAPALTNLAVISLPILDAALATEGIVWQYNGGTTETVVFLDDEATQMFATADDCLQGIDPVLPPVGDDQCEGAVAISEGTFTNAGPLSGESASNACFAGATNSTWYAYTASLDGIAMVSSSIDLDEPDTRVSIHSACDNLDCIASDDDGGEGFTSVVNFNVTAGTTYIVEWDDRWSAGEFDFEITIDDGSVDCEDLGLNIGDVCDDLSDLTENDIVLEDCTCVGTPLPDDAENAICADAISIGEGIVLAANIEGGDGAALGCFESNAINALWYAYTASDDGLATITSSIDQDLPDTRLSVYSGPCDDLTCFISNDDLNGELGFTSGVTFEVANGSTYLIEWDDRWDDGEFDFEVSLAPIVEPILGCTDGNACNYNELANEDDGTCLFALGCDVCDGLGGVIDNPEIGDACDDGLEETVNDIYINCNECLGFIPECFDPSACNFSGGEGVDHPSTERGDDGFCIYATGCDDCDGLGGVTDNPEIGDACDDGDETTTDDVLTACDICEGTPMEVVAENAICSDAIAISEGIVLAADISGGDGASNACATSATNAIYYTYTASADGVATISSSIDLDEPDTRVSIHASCEDLSCIASDDDSGEGFTSIASFDVTAGTTYIVEWDDRWDDGEFDFEITLESIVEEFDCPELEADFGDGCDDGDNSTENDIINDECICEGTPVAQFDCPELEANIGDGCDDGDETTENDLITADCICAGSEIVLDAENALCADAIAIGEGVVLAADIQGGNGATNACSGGAIHALYYSYTASADGVATVSSSIDLDQPDTRVSIHASCDDLDCIAFDDDGGEGFTSIASFDVTAGATYIVEWDDRWDDGEFDFEISLEPTVEPIEGCTDETACNYNPEATIEDESCDFGNWYIPSTVGAGPVVQACEAPEGYEFADQECIIALINDDPFCVEDTFDQFCFNAYQECLNVVFECETIDNSIWGTGPFIAGGTHYSFVAENANDAILAQGDGDVSIEIFDGECGGESLGVFDNYGDGEIERAVPGGLIAGNTYSYVVFGESSEGINTKVKTYASTLIEDEYCGSTMELIDQIYCSREEDMYQNPSVNVVGFSFRFVDQVSGDEIVLEDMSVDGFYQQLTTIAGFELGATYNVSARHKVIQSANGSVMSLWSDYGPACPVTIEAQVPLTNVRDEYCGGESTFNLADIIKAYPVVGADMYEWSFDNGIELVNYQTIGYPVYLYQIPGLEYGQAYNIQVRAHMNGNWGEFGSTCTILMDSQPEATKVRDTHCGLDYAYPSVELLYADYVGAATEYTWEFSNGAEVHEFTTSNYKLLMYQPDLSTGVYDVRVKAFAGGVYGDYAASCSISLNGGGDVANSQDSPIADKSLTLKTPESTVYPNPNSGDMVYLNVVNLDNVEGFGAINVVDMYGKIIMNEQVSLNGNSFNHELKLNHNLPAGMYMIQIQIENQLLVQKLIIE